MTSAPLRPGRMQGPNSLSEWVTTYTTVVRSLSTHSSLNYHRTLDGYLGGWQMANDDILDGPQKCR
ncbi:hypothetical protein QC763_0011710 [Podospora pseudopauciseta]|uniref:Uncharacterized protein n=1 Tax=Podospora pseudopauciseta TaxID=2093780 RepID=A0ABR0HZT6_9PEZI|nr:hypothetical protein QC763_0011710 [Podospora pseudopauciseta]